MHNKPAPALGRLWPARCGSKQYTSRGEWCLLQHDEQYLVGQAELSKVEGDLVALHSRRAAFFSTTTTAARGPELTTGLSYTRLLVAKTHR